MAERLDPQLRRARILDTAMAIIDEHGHQSLTLRGLARECGMSAPGLMHYFPDLPTLVVAVVDYRDQRDDRAWRERELLPLEPGQGVSRRVFDTVVDNIVARPKAAELFAIVEAQAIDPRHPGHEYFKERAERIADSAQGYLGAEFEEPRELARRLFSVMDGLQLNWLRDPTAFDLRERWDAIADAIFASATPKT
jgi:AcrR family transcriptional regulator